jgi:decaprenylphospho-beta-D-erythro-pentofuranosid-2-ulose 2-reductase
LSGKIGKPRRIIVLGALSTIAEAVARRLAHAGDHLVLAARDPARLSQVCADLTARGSPQAQAWPVDLATAEDVQGEFVRMTEALGGEVDAVLVFYGALGDQKLADADGQVLRQIIAVNFASAAEWCVAAAGVLERQKQGVLIALSSVAGDRGRQSNYAYGAAKAGLTVLMQGLAHRLAPSGARAVVIKLGFVDTAMTAHIKKGGPLWAKPDAIAEKIMKVVENPNKPVVYMPWFWRPIMSVIRNVPAPIFHKTKL